jgi:hypothetical protein
MTIPRRELLEYALEGMQLRRRIIQDQMREITAELAPQESSVPQKVVGVQEAVTDKEAVSEALAEIKNRIAAPKKRKKFSAATKRKIAASQKARWAKLKQIDVPQPVKQKKRQISAAGRKRIAAASKARWATAKAAGQNNLKSAKKGKAAGAAG